jgi:hypothetical protein
MQHGQPIAFYSRSLGPKATTQLTYHKEAFAILQALKKWRHYFLGGTLIIRTDQQSLKYMMSQQLAEGIQHKLLMKCDRTTSEMRGLSPKIISGDSR